MIDTIKICNVQVDGVETDDYPDFSNAYISYAQWEDGTELTKAEINELNEDGDFVYQAVIKQLY